MAEYKIHSSELKIVKINIIKTFDDTTHQFNRLRTLKSNFVCDNTRSIDNYDRKPTFKTYSR